MNRTDRLLAIVLELQRHKWQRAEDLAQTFAVSKRTIYRDIQALSEAGVPVVAMTGQGYSLPEGYFLPPVNFTVDEALMLILGSEFMVQSFDAQYRRAAISARHKIEAVLSVRRQTDVNYLRENIRFFAGRELDAVQEGYLRQLRRAIIEQKAVRLHYSTRHLPNEKGKESVREVEPYSLARPISSWMLMGYCHLRRAVRVFRLSRINRLEVLGKSFERPTGFVPEWVPPEPSSNVIAQLLFSHDVARWVLEMPPHFVVRHEETLDGLLVTLALKDENQALWWIMSWGAKVRVLEPESLRELILDTAEQILYNHERLLT